MPAFPSCDVVKESKMKVMTVTLIEKEKEPLTIKETYEIWQRLKARYPDAIVMLRRANDYYVFDSDAQIVTGVMQIEKPTTYQNKHLCILPYHHIDSMIRKLSKAGYRIAICEPQFFRLYQ